MDKVEAVERRDIRTLEEHKIWIEDNFSSKVLIGEDEVEQYTDKAFVIKVYKHLREELKKDCYQYEFCSPAESWVSSYCSVKLSPNNIVSLNELKMAGPNRRHEGKLFLCRTITASIKMGYLLTVVEVPLFMGERGVFLTLHNYRDPSDEDADSSMPTLNAGTIVVVKNPVLYASFSKPRISVRSDNPAEVNELSENEFKQCFPGYTWPSGEFQNKEDLQVMKHASSKKTEDWLSTGHFCLQRKNYIAAIDAYTLALKDNHKDIEALSHRCSLKLNFKMCKDALEDSDEILKIDPFHNEGICYRARSLLGLGKYTMAIDYLKSHMEEAMKKPYSVQKDNLIQLLTKAEALSKQERYGDYDVVSIFQASETCQHDCADYVGNVEKRYIEGKGIGMIATKDIKCGDLIVGAKAFAMAFPDRDGDRKQHWVYDRNNLQYEALTQVKLRAIVTHLLLRHPELGREFYKLYDGTQRTSAKCISDEVEYKFVDAQRIEAICRFNGFSGEARIVERIEEEDDRPVMIFLSASYFNHNCSDANSNWKICGNFIFVRAIRNIFKSEEITIPYTSGASSYPTRSITLSKYGFVCDCNLCLLDSQDSEEVHKRRDEILDRLDNVETAENVLDELEKLIIELQNLRPNHSKLNVYIHYPLTMLIKQCIAIKDYASATSLACRTYAVTHDTIFHEVSLQCCCDAMWCYLQEKNYKKAKICGWALKTALIKEFGHYSEKILKHVSLQLAEVMAQHNIVL